jgi:hypothetical protein
MRVDFVQKNMACRYLGKKNSKGKIEPICPVAIGDFDPDKALDTLMNDDYVGQTTMFIANENRKVLEHNGLSTLLCFDFGRGDDQTAKIFEGLYISEDILNDICIDSTGENEASFLGEKPKWNQFPECAGIGSIPCEISSEDYEGKRGQSWKGRLLIIELI